MEEEVKYGSEKKASVQDVVVLDSVLSKILFEPSDKGFKERRMPAKFKYQITKVIKNYQDDLSFYYENREKLFEKYKDKVVVDAETGQQKYDLSDEERKEFDKEFEEIIKVLVDASNVYRLERDEFLEYCDNIDVDLSYKDFEVLDLLVFR